MKSTLAAIALFALGAVGAHAQAIGIGQFSVVNSSITVPKQLTNAVVLAKRITIIGKNVDQSGANAGDVYIGSSSSDGRNGYPVATGTTHVFEPPISGGYIDLSTIYFDVTVANDGIWVMYE